MMASVVGMWTLRECGLFSVIEKDSGRWIGRVGPWMPEGDIAEVGWAILPTMWGRGYATEAARAAIDWAIAHCSWREINHCIDKENSASIAVARKLGGEWLRSDLDSHGKAIEVYGQTRERWISRS